MNSTGEVVSCPDDEGERVGVCIADAVHAAARMRAVNLNIVQGPDSSEVEVLEIFLDLVNNITAGHYDPQ